MRRSELDLVLKKTKRNLNLRQTTKATLFGNTKRKNQRAHSQDSTGAEVVATAVEANVSEESYFVVPTRATPIFERGDYLTEDEQQMQRKSTIPAVQKLSHSLSSVAIED